MFQILVLMLAVPRGLSSAAGYLIGKEIGKGNVEEAKEYYRVATRHATTVSLGLTLILVLGFDRIASLYTHDKEVLVIFKQSSWLIGAGAFFDNMGNYFQGPIKALGI
mmetsp:Transcript_729/g.905  ORF Transcript_729/g.905 Transcript_729/m.905 type:complete len:108 (-) Transcript_729:218-541(-)